MVKYRKLMVLSLIIMAVTGLCGAGVIRYLSLDEPVFVENYIAYTLYQESNSRASFALNYITDSDDKRTVNSMQFPEAENAGVNLIACENQTFTVGNMFGMSSTYNARAVGRFLVHTVEVSVMAKDAEGLKEIVSLKKANVAFSNGDTQTVSVGNIVLYPESYETRVLSQISCSSTSSGTHVSSSSSWSVGKDMTVKGIESFHLNEINEYAKIKINNQDYTALSGTKLKSGNVLSISNDVELSSDIFRKYTNYCTPIFLRYTDESGCDGVTIINTFIHNPQFTDQWDLVRYLRARGEI